MLYFAGWTVLWAPICTFAGWTVNATPGFRKRASSELKAYAWHTYPGHKDLPLPHVSVQIVSQVSSRRPLHKVQHSQASCTAGPQPRPQGSSDQHTAVSSDQRAGNATTTSH